MRAGIYPVIVRRLRIRLCGVAALIAIAILAPGEVSGPDIVNFLEQSIAWYRQVQTVEQNSDNVLLRESVLQTSLQVVRLGFDFAHAEAALIDTQQPSAPKTASSNLQQAATKAADRVSGIQARISDLDAQLSKAPSRERATLEAQRSELNSELELAKQIQATIQTLIRFSGNAGGAAGLTEQINQLERTIPEAQPGPANARAAPKTTTTAAPAAPKIAQPESRGIIGLTGDLITLSDRRKQVSDLQKRTDELLATIDRFRTPLLNQARSSIQGADAIENAPPPKTAADAKAAQDQLIALSARFKQLSGAMLPLSEQAIALGNMRGDLQEEIKDLDDTRTRSARYLLLRVGGIAGMIFIILVISSIWRRATFKYVTDARRRRQFLTVRRIVVSCAVLITIVIGFVTEFGSLATYAGFVTAGIAVALQNPILAVVGYFFLIGKYGLRVGDRVTISGVTGEVMEIGLVRIYLMELGPDGHSTGRIVVFSNSVIFQPAALYKQMPGLDYVWHSATLTLSGDSDFQLAETKLKEAVDSVYQEYRDRFERQHQTFQQSTDLSLSVPRPESRLRFIDAGIEFTVRYPVVLREAAATDDRMMKALHDVIENEPKLKFAPSGRPKVQLAA